MNRFSRNVIRISGPEKDTLTELGESKYTIAKMCEWLEVSTSGYYEWRGPRRIRHRAAARVLGAHGGKAFEDSEGT